MKLQRQPLTGNCDPNECINKLADVIYDISFQLKGKTFVHKTVLPKNITRKVSPWFANSCKIHKNVFYVCKRAFKNAPSKSSPRKFWKYINKSSLSNSDVNIEDFVQHFKNLYNTPHFSSFFNDDDNVSRDLPVDVDELDCEFSYTEIIKTICNMNRHKSADTDGNVVDFLLMLKSLLPLIL